MGIEDTSGKMSAEAMDMDRYGEAKPSGNL